MLIFFILICVIAIAIFALPYVLIPKNVLPQPSGQWQVGTSEIAWKSPDYPQTRIIANVWYPTAEKSGINSPYLHQLGQKFADPIATNLVYKLIFSLLRRVSTIPVFTNATPLQTFDGLPIVVFSPGFGGINYFGTFYALEFASHGFIVIGVNHPKSNVGTMCIDGSQIKFENFNTSIFNEPDKLEKYIGNIARTQAMNISIIVDEIIQLNSTLGSLFYQIIDSSRIFAAGHSAGGSASFAACGRDRRISRGIDLDGAYVDLDLEIADYAGKKLLLIHSDREKYKPKNKLGVHQYSAMIAIDKKWTDKLGVKADLQKTLFESTTHSGFTDLSILINPAIGKKIGLLGRSDGLTILRESASIMIDFLNGNM
jgi:Platelet-activating factor acetylhydrolase, isoform II